MHSLKKNKITHLGEKKRWTNKMDYSDAMMKVGVVVAVVPAKKGETCLGGHVCLYTHRHIYTRHPIFCTLCAIYVIYCTLA